MHHCATTPPLNHCIPTHLTTCSSVSQGARKTDTFKKQYASRAGIEGTISQGVRSMDLRRSRYIGLAKKIYNTF
jgi:hypothetical protein